MQLWSDASTTAARPTTGRWYTRRVGECWKQLLHQCEEDTVYLTPLHIWGTAAGVVSSYRYLGIHISNKLIWSWNASCLVRKAHQHFFLLRRLRRATLRISALTSFYRCMVEIVLCSCITIWYSSCCTAQKALNRVVKAAQDCGMQPIYHHWQWHLQMREKCPLQHERSHQSWICTVCPSPFRRVSAEP